MIDPVYSASPSRYECGMTYRRCGKSGILLPVVSLGLWHNFGDVDTLANSRAMIHYAFDHGISAFDLANNYGPSYGSAEETFGQIMVKSMHPYRDEMFISSKAGYDMWPGPYGNWGSRKYLMASLDQSLKRMHLDYVDVFYSHRYDPETPLEETLQALVDIVRQGKALYAGISRWPREAAQFAYKYLADRDVKCLLYQGRYNMIDRETVTDGTLPGAAENGVGYVAFSPLAQGILTGRYLNGIPEHSRASRDFNLPKSDITPQLIEKMRSLDAIARGRGQTLAEMSLAWVLANPAVTSVIIGTSSVNQLADNIHALDKADFTPEELATIDNILEIK